MSDPTPMSQSPDDDWRVDVRESVVQQAFCSILGLDAVMSYMSFNHSISVTQGIEALLDKQVHDQTGSKPRFRVAFITNLNMAITQGTPEVKLILSGVETLLHTVFTEDGDKGNITRLLKSKARNDGNLYAVVAIVASLLEKKGQGKIEVISASLGCYAGNVGGYLGYLATRQSKYSTNRYGKSADGEAFQRRGMGQLMVTLFQFLVFWRSYQQVNQVKPTYLHCEEKRESTFKKFGFTRCDDGIPRNVSGLQHLLGITSSCVKENKLIPMSIQKAVLGTFAKAIKLSATGLTPFTQVSVQMLKASEVSPQTNVTVPTPLSIMKAAASNLLPSTTSTDMQEQINENTKRLPTATTTSKSSKRQRPDTTTAKEPENKAEKPRKTVHAKRKNTLDQPIPKKKKSETMPEEEGLPDDAAAEEKNTLDQPISKTINKEKGLPEKKGAKQKNTLDQPISKTKNKEKGLPDDVQEKGLPEKKGAKQKNTLDQPISKTKNKEKGLPDDVQRPSRKKKLLKTYRECVQQIFQTKRHNLTTGEVRELLLSDFQCTLSKKDWKLVKEYLSELIQGDKTTITPTLQAALNEVIQEKPIADAPKKLRHLVEMKIGGMVPQQLWDHAKKRLLEMVTMAVYDEEPCPVTTSDFRNHILTKYGIQLKKPRWIFVKEVVNELIKARLEVTECTIISKDLQDIMSASVVAMRGKKDQEATSGHYRQYIEKSARGMLPQELWSVVKKKLTQMIDADLYKNKEANTEIVTTHEPSKLSGDAEVDASPEDKNLESNLTTLFENTSLDEVMELPEAVVTYINEVFANHTKGPLNITNLVMSKFNCSQPPNNIINLMKDYWEQLCSSEHSGSEQKSNAVVTHLRRGKEMSQSAGNDNLRSEVTVSVSQVERMASRSTSKKNMTRDPSNYTVTDVVEVQCPACKRVVFKEDSSPICMYCKSCVHNGCGTTYKCFSSHIDNTSTNCLCRECTNTAYVFLCFPCGVTKLTAERYRVATTTVKDAELVSAWSETSHRKTLSQEERQQRKDTPKKRLTKEQQDQELQDKSIQLQEWLSYLHAVKYSSKQGAYYVRCVVDGEQKTKLLEWKFMEESVLLLDEEFIEQVKKNKSGYTEVTALIKENVQHRAELWAGPNDIYERYNECLAMEQWTHLKVNYGGDVATALHHQDTLRFIQSKTEFHDKTKDYSITLKNEPKKKQIAYVPRYYMFIWKVVQNYFHGNKEDPNDINLVEKKAFEKPNRWIEIPPGRASTSIFPLPRSCVTLFKNVYLQENEASCVVTSLANALMYINDKEGANELMKHKKECLATTRRLQFVANILSKMKYRVTKLNTFDILGNTSKWPTICGLTGSDGGRGHAISVCGRFVFDGNAPYAMDLTKENLNWCCGATDVDIEYVEVHLAYRFEMVKKIPKHFQNI